MHVFLTGSTGWIGSLIARDLIEAGHQVTGLVRSADKADLLRPSGATPLIGEVSDLALLARAAGAADGVIHTAFGTDLTRIAAMAEEDRAAIEAMGEALLGSARPLIVTDGFLESTPEPATEDRRPPLDPNFPRASQQTAFALAERGVHASVVRNPRSVHGRGETHGFMPWLAAVARERGVSAWVGDGTARWPSVHRADAARLYRLALEKGARGEAWHAVAEEGVPFRAIAEALGRGLGLPSRSIPPEEAEAHFGPLALWVTHDGPASSAHTRAELGWTPVQPTLVEDIERPDYLG